MINIALFITNIRFPACCRSRLTATPPLLVVKDDQTVLDQGNMPLPLDIYITRVAVPDARGHGILFQEYGVAHEI